MQSFITHYFNLGLILKEYVRRRVDTYFPPDPIGCYNVLLVNETLINIMCNK